MSKAAAGAGDPVPGLPQGIGDRRSGVQPISHESDETAKRSKDFTAAATLMQKQLEKVGSTVGS
jgi:hypothetical protein